MKKFILDYSLRLGVLAVKLNLMGLPNASSPASTWTTAASSKASGSWRSATPAIRSRSRVATTSRARTKSPSSTSPPAPTTARPWCTWSRRWRSRYSSRSPSAAASARSKTCGACSTPAPTRWRSTPPP